MVCSLKIGTLTALIIFIAQLLSISFYSNAMNAMLKQMVVCDWLCFHISFILTFEQENFYLQIVELHQYASTKTQNVAINVGTVDKVGIKYPHLKSCFLLNSFVHNSDCFFFFLFTGIMLILLW